MSYSAGGANCFNGYDSTNRSEKTRPATHAGSWYSGSPKELNRQLSNWLDRAGPPLGIARAILSPHAGYNYCGEVAAYAFKQIVPDLIKRVFVLGPSHVVFLNGCALTTCTKYSTPLGDLIVDTAINHELMSLNDKATFEYMSEGDEEAEHSIEMQMPFIAKVMGRKSTGSFTIVPILVGSLSDQRQASYGKVFAKYIADPSNLFVISSDFCHWGNRFRYTPLDSPKSVDVGTSVRPIYEQITSLDQAGMEAISALDPVVFNDYLKKTQNTICGRNPISLMLQAAEHFRQMNNHSAEFRFLKYAQSNKCRNVNDSSVSYAAGALFINPKK